MSEALLVQIIFVLCSNSSTKHENKEERIGCFETYTNCAIGPNGIIMDLETFRNKCIKK